jgi:mRNA-degrading endonuclease HigB of HigAB toxin-antitoxin module
MNKLNEIITFLGSADLPASIRVIFNINGNRYPIIADVPMVKEGK